MATIDTSYVRRELRAIAGSSNAVRKLLHDALERIESDPSVFELLDEVHPKIRQDYQGLALRKVKIQSGRQNYRLILAHW